MSVETGRCVWPDPIPRGTVLARSPRGLWYPYRPDTHDPAQGIAHADRYFAEPVIRVLTAGHVDADALIGLDRRARDQLQRAGFVLVDLLREESRA